MATSVFNESNFSRRPDRSQMPKKYRLLRVPPEGYRGVICLSHDVCGADVHYWGGRTKCCLGKDCPADHSKTRIEWRGYLFFWSPRKQEIACIELTAAAMAPIDQAFNEYRTLRGCKMEFARLGERKNGELSSKVFAPAKNLEQLPESPSLRKFLCKVWQVEYFDDRQVVTDDMLAVRKAGEILRLDKSAG